MSKIRSNFIQNVKDMAVSENEFSENQLLKPLIFKVVEFQKPFTVVGLTVEILGQVFIAVEQARCHPKDEWSDDIGEDIALSRAAARIWKMFTGKEETAEVTLSVNAFGLEILE